MVLVGHCTLKDCDAAGNSAADTKADTSSTFVAYLLDIRLPPPQQRDRFDVRLCAPADSNRAAICPTGLMVIAIYQGNSNGKERIRVLSRDSNVCCRARWEAPDENECMQRAGCRGLSQHFRGAAWIQPCEP